MKYVMLRVVQTFSDGGTMERLVPAIFPDLINHDDMALFLSEALRASWGSDAQLTIEAKSAGSISVFVDEAYGKSITLGLASDKNDRAVINGYDYLHGIVG